MQPATRGPLILRDILFPPNPENLTEQMRRGLQNTSLELEERLVDKANEPWCRSPSTWN
jgi:hypothetical protein